MENNKIEKITNLWSGYGAVYRVYYYCEDNGKKKKNVILKHVAPPRQHDVGEDGVGHERKLRSYENEMFFYEYVTGLVQKEEVKHEIFCPMATWVPKSDLNGIEDLLKKIKTGGKDKKEIMFFMSDLKQLYPIYVPTLNQSRTLTILDWLSSFHSLFFYNPALKSSEKLSKRGTYWYLSTRKSRTAEDE